MVIKYSSPYFNNVRVAVPSRIADVELPEGLIININYNYMYLFSIVNIFQVLSPS